MDLQAELASKLGLGKQFISPGSSHLDDDSDVKSMASEWDTESMHQDNVSIASSKKSKKKTADTQSIGSKRSRKSKRGSSVKADTESITSSSKGRHDHRTKSIESRKSLKKGDSSLRKKHKKRVAKEGKSLLLSFFDL